jgi:hypothetical protein
MSKPARLVMGAVMVVLGIVLAVTSMQAKPPETTPSPEVTVTQR